MSKNITTRTPAIKAEDVLSPHKDEMRGRVPQRVTLADQYQKIGDWVVRYRVAIDGSYLVQSTMEAEVWTDAGWTNLVTLQPEVEFYIVNGPDVAATDPQSRELTRLFDAENAAYAAQSYQKVYDLLAAEAKKVLAAIG